MIPIAEFAPRFAARARTEKSRFLAALSDAREQQRELFARHVSANADTEFGRAHDFGKLRDLEDYRRAVPIRSYDELRPWVARMVAGERAVLTEADPILFFLTTGTTGEPKHIPITRDSLRGFARNNLVWWASLIESYPALLERDDTVVMLHLSPMPYRDLTPAGVPLLNPTRMPSDADGGFPFSRAPWFPPPSDLAEADRLYYFLRAAIESPIAGFVCLHPNRFQSLIARLESDGPRLVEELRAGTLLGRPHRAPNPARADEVARLVAAGTMLPRHVWPSLAFASTWVGGAFKLHQRTIEESFGCEIFPHMSASAECGHLTMPVDRECADGPLTIQTNLYEFLPVTESEPDRSRLGDKTLSFDQLDVGGTYELVTTTCAGLYRYASGDRFEVLGYSHGVPRVSFAGRGGVVDLTGEKLTEQHVQLALDRALEGAQLDVRNATCVPLLGRPPRYAFVLELSSVCPPERLSSLAARLDEELRRLNPRFLMMRNLGDLAAPTIRIVAQGSFARYRELLVARGLPSTQLKDKVLHADPDVLTTLTSLSVER